MRGQLTGDGFEQLVQEALAQPFAGWDFSWLKGRWREGEPDWDYRQLVEARVPGAQALLDMGTGGGEFLASLPERPATTYATEAYPPNIPVARERLEPLGVTVVPLEDEERLPLASGQFDLVINRHEYYNPDEVERILRPGGVFLTQQVGPRDCIQLNQFLEAPIDPAIVDWSVEQEVALLEGAGLRLLRREEQLLESVFLDIGAVVFFIKIIEWQFPDFSVAAYRERLEAMHRVIERQGAFFATAHRYLLLAEKQ